MRTFGASFAAEMAKDSAEPFLTAVFGFTSGRGAVYLSDQAVTIDGHVHVPIVPKGGWGSLGSTVGRTAMTLDVQAVVMKFDNKPGPFPNNERFSDILQVEAEATLVSIFQNFRLAGGSIVQELLFVGLVQGLTAWSADAGTITINALHERYLLGNVLRTASADDHPFIRPSDNGATIPRVLGRVPQTPGRVVKGEPVSVIEPDEGNAGTGELDHVEVSLSGFAKRNEGYSARRRDYRIVFTSASAFGVYETGVHVKSGTITEDFVFDDGAFVIPAGAWNGIFEAGDEFTFTIDTEEALVILSEAENSDTFQAIGSVYANGVALNGTGVRITVETDVGNESTNLGVAPNVSDGLVGGTIVRNDDHVGGSQDTVRLYQSKPDTDPSKTLAIVSPFTVPRNLTDATLLKVKTTLGTGGTTPLPHAVHILEDFDPSRTFAPDEELAVPGSGFTAADDPDQTRPVEAARYVSRSPHVTDRGYEDGNQHEAWHPVYAPLTPGRKYWIMQTVDPIDGDSSNFWETQVREVVDSYNGGSQGTYRPGAGQGYIWRQGGGVGGWEPMTLAGDPSIAMTNWWAMYYRGRRIGSLEPEAPGPVSGDGSVLGQDIDINQGFIAVGLGAEFYRNPDAKGSVVIALMAAERTGEAREMVGSIEVSAADLQGATGYGFVEKFLDKPVIVRPGLYHVELKGKLSESREYSGWTTRGVVGNGSSLFGGASTYKTGSSYGKNQGAVWMPTYAGSTQLQTIIEERPIRLAISIKAATITKQITDDGTGHRVARVRFGDTYLPSEWQITADCIGVAPGGSARTDQVVRALAQTGAGVPTAYLDLAGSFAASGTAYGSIYKSEGTILEQQSWKQLFLRIAFENRSIIDWSVDKLQLKFLPDPPAASVGTITKSTIPPRELVPELTIRRTEPADLANSFDLRWNRIWREAGERYARVTRREDARSIAVYGKREKAGLFDCKYIRNRRQAERVATFWLHRMGKPKNIVDVHVKLPHLAIEKDDVVTVSGI